MKKSIYISCLILFYGCVFTYDPARGLLYVHNNSNEAIYVYLKYGNVDSLPLISSLELFTFIDANMKDAFTICGNRKKPRLPSNENVVTLFIITEKMMCNYDLEGIHRNQIFAKRITLTKEELEKKNWIVTYP